MRYTISKAERNVCYALCEPKVLECFNNYVLESEIAGFEKGEEITRLQEIVG